MKQDNRVLRVSRGLKVFKVNKDRRAIKETRVKLDPLVPLVHRACKESQEKTLM